MRRFLQYAEIVVGLGAFTLGMVILIVSCATTALLDAISRPFIPSRTYQSPLYAEDINP